MPSSVSHPLRDLSRLDRAWWLPPGGLGNGLDAVGWAQIMDADAPLVAPVLQALRSEGIPGYAAPAVSATKRRPARGGRHRYRIWVGASYYSRAEDALMRVLPRLADLPAADKAGGVGRG